jgi:NAD(P)-dependent dehydrogenase (short-subunit alcohol dehydrogenase family)
VASASARRWRSLAAATPLLVVGRDPAKGQRAAEELRVAGAGEGTTFLAADLSELSAVGTLVDRVRASGPRLHALVNNAAQFTPRRVATADGLEAMFATNALARIAGI